MKTLKSLLLLLPFTLLIHNLNGQGTVQTQVNPDCPVVSIGLTLTAGSGATITVPGGNGFDNRVIGCQTYTLQYVATASSGSLTGITFQAAGGAATPGTFSAFPGTVSTGINPNTSNTGAISTFSTGCTSSSACTVANAWLNVLITRGTFVGNIQLVVYGWKNGSAKAGGGGGGGGGGPTIAGTLNQITALGAGCTSPSTATCTIALANNTVLPGNPSTPGTMTASGFISDEAASGNLQMNGLTSGNVTLAVNDIAGTAIAYVWPSTNGSVGQVIEDNGVTTCPTLPAGAPSVCHALIWTTAPSGTAGGGVLGYSASALTLPTAGTTFLAPAGGAQASATEANVTALAPAAAVISNMYVNLSNAPGAGNTITFTYRDAGSSTALTCTISGAVATACHDITHSFTPSIGDALSVEVDTTGTVVITPTIRIIAEYGVTGGGGGGSISQGACSSLPGSVPASGTYYQCSDTPYNFISDGSAWHGYFATYPITVPLVCASWTWVNQLSSSCGGGGNYPLILTTPSNASLSNALLVRAVPSTPYSITATFTVPIIDLANACCLNAGLVFYASGSTKFVAFEVGTGFNENNCTVGTPCLRVEEWNSPTSDNTGLQTGRYLYGASVPGGFTLKIRDDGTHRTYYLSSDGGLNFIQWYQEASGTFITPTHYGLVLLNLNSGGLIPASMPMTIFNVVVGT